MRHSIAVKRVICFASLFLIGLFLTRSNNAEQPADRPNVILVMADDLGWGDTGYNGHPHIKTPALDEMAKNGVRLDRSYAGAPVCSPTRGSCLTGRNPFRYGIYKANVGHLKKEEITLAEVFKQSGYATGHFGKWHLGTMSDDYSGKKERNPQANYMTPGMAGFDEWFSTEFAVPTYDPYTSQDNGKVREPRSLYWHNGELVLKPLEGCDSKIIMDKAIPFIESAAARGTPFFSVIWFHAPHGPVVGHPKYMEQWYADQPDNQRHYYSVVSALDAQVGRLRAKLRDLKIAENTLVCFTSDNGPEGNPVAKNRYQGSAGHLRGRKRALYEGGIRVPGLIEWPGKLPATTVSVPCVTSDYFVTCCQILGVPLSPRPYDGIDLMPVLTGKQTERGSSIGFQYGQNAESTHRALITDRFKLVSNPSTVRATWDNGNVPTDLFELYDIVSDPSEKTNVASQNPQVFADLKIKLESFVASCKKSNQGDDYAKTKKFQSNWNSLKDFPVPRWFDDAKFGIFIHWGPYSVLGYRKGGRGYSEHVPKMIYSDPEHYYPYLQSRFGAHPPDFGYKDVIARFKAEKFDPNAWAKLFESSGAKYVVLTAEHHDGYAMWDSDLTDWCATKVGPMRDVVGELGAAVREQGLKYAPSYHRERHTGFFAKDLYAIRSEPRADIAKEIQRMPSASQLYGPFDYDDAFIDDYVARWKEIQTKYHPDFMWIDDIPIFTRAPDDPQTEKFLQACCEMIADFLNCAAERGQEVYLNNKGKTQNWPVNLGCLEKDNLQMSDVGPKWENPATLGTSYGYMQAEEVQDLYKTPQKLIHLLCDVVSKNGNLLLNIGPRGDGTIPEGMQQRLLEIGKWLETNGEAIYGTRAWNVFGEGVTEVKNKKDAQGRHTINSTGIRFTRSLDGDTLYAILLECPEEKVIVESLKNVDVTAVELIGSDDQLRWNSSRAGLTVELPIEKPCEHAYVLRIGLR